MLELLQGKLSHQVMTRVTDRKDGLFPQPGEIEFDCDCPDWAHMCKHVAAVLYGVGSRLDHHPELLFLLRDVDAQELISADIDLPSTRQDAGGEIIADEQLSGIFGIDLDDAGSVDPVIAPEQRIPSKRSHPENSLPKTGREKLPKSAEKRGIMPLRPGTRKVARSESPGARQMETVDPPLPVLPKIHPTGKSVARLRKLCGMSVKAFARQLGVSAVSVYRWEAASGKLKLQDSSLNAMARLQADRNATAK
jgi:DNA-binding transcriptional regulator YiaG